MCQDCGCGDTNIVPIDVKTRILARNDDAAMHNRELETLFIENVGNMVCPAVYDLGQNVNVVTLSVTEGEDKPLKYPTMFSRADLVLLTKVDLLPHLGITVGSIYDALGRVMPVPQVIALSAIDDDAVAMWLEWLTQRRAAALQELLA